MLGILCLCTLFNTLLGITFGIIYFKNTYVVVKKDIYDALIETVSNLQEEQPQELVGGTGFFKEYIEEEEEE